MQFTLKKGAIQNQIACRSTPTRHRSPTIHQTRFPANVCYKNVHADDEAAIYNFEQKILHAC